MFYDLIQQSHSRYLSNRSENICPYKDLYIHVYCSIIYNSKTHQLMIGQTVIYVLYPYMIVYLLTWLYHGLSRCLSVCGCVCAQPCLTPCDPMDCSPPGASVHGIFQARMLQWVSISISRVSYQPRDWAHVLLHILQWQADSQHLCHLGN